jgi:hypothetical protein
MTTTAAFGWGSSYLAATPERDAVLEGLLRGRR